MSEEHLTSVIKENGEILFIFADKYSVYTVYRIFGENKAFLVVCDKRLFIERAEYLEVPEWFFGYTTVRFFKPKQYNDEITFPGVVEIDGKMYRFEIKEGEAVKLQEMTSEFEPTVKQTHHLLPVLETFEVTHGIQNRDKFYFVGIEQEDPEACHPVYGVVDMLSGELETVYYLYSDAGEIEPACLTIDFHERNVYVVGKTKVYNRDTVVAHKPFIEQFMLRS